MLTRIEKKAWLLQIKHHNGEETPEVIQCITEHHLEKQ